MIEYEQSLIEYEKALAEYEKVEARNALRKELKETSFTKTYYTLYFFDGSESKVISTRALKGADEGEYIDDYVTSPIKKAVIEYSDYDAPSGKIKLSEINSADEVNERVEEFFPRLANLKIAIKDKDAKLDYNPWIFHTYISEDMEFIYILGNSSYGEAGNLYKIAVGQESLGEMQKIETDLSYENFSLQGNDLIYLKNSGLYINRHKAADIKRGTFAGTSYNGYDYLKDLQLLYYINENDEFVVKDLAEGSEKIIDKGVFCFRTFEGGEFFYIKKDANNKDCIYTIINDKIALIADGADSYEMIDSEKNKSLLKNISGALVDFRPVGGYL